MLTATQKRLHQQAFTMLTDCEILLSLMEEFTKIKEELKHDPVRAAYYQKKVEANAAKRNAKLEEYFELLKQIVAPFENDLHEGTPPEPHLPRISAVQLSESFYNVNP